MDNYNIDVREEIRARADIAQIVGRYVKLKSSGSNMKGLCPFHKEKSPSFNVNPAKGIYHCFGCQKGGDIFSFLMDIEGISFPEALKRLADEVGVEMPQYSNQSYASKPGAINRNRALEIHQWALVWFYNKMKENPLAVEYFKGRGLTGEIVRDFRLGYAPEGWSGLLEYLASVGASKDELVQCGLVVSSSSGDSVYDRFRNRIIFPLFDVAGKAIGFAGRGMEKDAKPKYLNSPETILYKKNRYLYGLDKAREAIKQKEYAIFVEGYMDYLSLFQSGIKNVVAASGTALTEGHGQLIKRFVNRVILLFDGDEAGLKAAERSVFVLFPLELEVKVCILSDGEDPDSFIKSKGVDEFLDLISIAEDSFRFLIRRGREMYGATSANGKSSIIKYLKPVINQTSDPIIKTEFIRTLCGELDLTESSIIQSLGNSDSYSIQEEEIRRILPRAEELLLTEEGSFIHLLVRKPELLLKYKDKISLETVSAPYIKNLYSIIEEEITKYGDLENLLLHVRDPRLKSIFSLMMITDLPEGDMEANLEHKLGRFRNREYKNKMREITRRLKTERDPEVRTRLLQKQQELTKSYGERD